MGGRAQARSMSRPRRTSSTRPSLGSQRAQPIRLWDSDAGAPTKIRRGGLRKENARAPSAARRVAEAGAAALLLLAGEADDKRDACAATGGIPAAVGALSRHAAVPPRVCKAAATATGAFITQCFLR
jgi:hypothetical protein